MRPRPPDDGGERVDDGDARDDERDDDGGEAGDAGDREKRDGPEREAERERARISHEDRRGVEVVAEEAEGGARHGHGEHRGVDATGPGGEDEHRDRRDAADARGEPVQPVDEVDDVDVRDEVDDRRWVGDPSQFDDAGCKRVVDDADDETARSGDGCREHLSYELLQGRERIAVVEKTGHEYHHERQADHPVPDLEVRGRREHRGPVPETGSQGLHDECCNNAQEDSYAAHARRGTRVDAAGARIVDGIDAPGNPSRQRGGCERREERSCKDAEIGQTLRQARSSRHETTANVANDTRNDGFESSAGQAAVDLHNGRGCYA